MAWQEGINEQLTQHEQQLRGTGFKANEMAWRASQAGAGLLKAHRPAAGHLASKGLPFSPAPAPALVPPTVVPPARPVQQEAWSTKKAQCKPMGIASKKDSLVLLKVCF
jgi:hypothetical protein